MLFTWNAIKSSLPLKVHSFSPLGMSFRTNYSWLDSFTICLLTYTPKSTASKSILEWFLILNYFSRCFQYFFFIFFKALDFAYVIPGGFLSFLFSNSDRWILPICSLPFGSNRSGQFCDCLKFVIEFLFVLITNGI